MNSKHYIAVDCGSSNGKMVDVAYDGEKISIAGSKPFLYEPVNVLGTLYNDVLGIYSQVINHFKEFVYENKPGAIRTIGVTAWGGDYGLFGEDGKLLANMSHHRDNRTLKILEEFFMLISEREFFYQTGSIFFRGIGPCQLFCDKKNSPVYDIAKTLLGTPNVLTYFLSGVKIMDDTIASSLGFTDRTGKQWNKFLMDRLGLRMDLFPEICEPGTLLGKVAANVGEYVGDANIDVVCSAGHDTPAGMVAVSGMSEETVFISMGTMMLVGSEAAAPVYQDTVLNGEFRMVTSPGGKFLIYRDVQGFGILNQCMKSFSDRGYHYTFDELEVMARKLPVAKCIINTNDPVFYHRDSDMMKRIQLYCKDTGQYIPENPEEVYRCLIDSYTLAARSCIEELTVALGRKFNNLRLINGGSQCALLGEMISECTGMPVYSGLRYATALGNALIQMAAVKEVSGLDEMRELSERSFGMKEIDRNKNDFWEDVYTKSLALRNRKENK